MNCTLRGATGRDVRLLPARGGRVGRGRTALARDLSWWALLEMAPTLPDEAPPWAPGSILLPEQGLAILRTPRRYASLECGRFGGGHGHPDRLHLTLHADGHGWLADPGTGSYVSPDLFWYRSTLAHNAPRLDGRSQPPGDAVARRPAPGGRRVAWVRGRFGDLTRTLVAGPYLLDVVEVGGAEARLLELPWHLDGRVEVVTPGGWTETSSTTPSSSRSSDSPAPPNGCRAPRPYRRGRQPDALPPVRRRAAPRQRAAPARTVGSRGNAISSGLAAAGWSRRSRARGTRRRSGTCGSPGSHRGGNGARHRPPRGDRRRLADRRRYERRLAGLRRRQSSTLGR